MPTYLQAVDVPERCFLGEALLWVAFQRLPTGLYTYDGKEVRETDEVGELGIDIADWTITEEEARRANIPADPEYLALLKGKSTSLPEFYDDPLRRYEPDPEVRAQLVEERAQAEVFERERKAWEPFYQRAIEYPASLIFVALKSGQLRARGRLLPGKSAEEAGEILQADDKNVYDFPVTDIPDAFWSLNGIDFQASAAGNGSAYYCHVSCNTPDVLSLFPCERKQVSGIEQVGDCFVLDESVRKLPVNSRRGRPPYPWEVFHVEIADLIRRGGLPAKKEAAIQFFQTWFQSQFGISVSRAAIGEKLKPYYERFSRRGGEKIAG